MKLKTKKIKKISLYTIGIIIGIYILVGLYSFIFEQDKLKIDRYNFEQLEKAKPILAGISKDDEYFDRLQEFNSQYVLDLKSIENCYYVSNYNGNQKYIFGFQLKSKIYKLIYFGNSYAYPKYSMPYRSECDGFNCYDGNKNRFKNIISQPCIDN